MIPSFRSLLAAGVAGVLWGATPGFAAPADSTYASLTLSNLPPAAKIIEQALDHLPKTLAEQKDWVERMRKATLVPRVEFRYTIAEDAYRRYRNLTRQEVQTGSETTTYGDRESGSQQSVSSGSGSQSISSSETGSESSSRNDGLTESVTSSSSGSQSRQSAESGSEFQSSSSSRSGSSRSSSQSVTDLGPDSYVTKEDLRWVNEFGVFLTWDLSHLVFHPDEIPALDSEISRQTFRIDMKTRVAEVYYDLVEALLLLENEAYRQSVPTLVRKERGAFLIDELTGGYITATLRQQEAAAAPAPVASDNGEPVE